MSALQRPSLCFTPGSYFRHGTTVFQIADEHLGLLTLVHATSGDRKVVPEADLYPLYLSGELVAANEGDVPRAAAGDLFLEDETAVVEPPLPHLSEAAIKDGRNKLQYIRELRALGYGSLRPNALLELDLERLARKIGDASPPALSTIYLASLKLDKAGGDARALFPRFSDRGGYGKVRTSPAALAAYTKACDWLRRHKKERIRPGTVRSKIFVALTATLGRERAIEETPSDSSLRRQLVNTFGQYEIDLRNRGAAFVKKKYRTWHHRDQAIAPLEVIEFDDKDTRVFLMDEVTGLPCGRSYITAGIDQCTRVLLGTASDDLPRSLMSAKEAMVKAVLPFDPHDWRYSDVKSLPPTFGQFGIAIFDNALYNHAPDLDTTALELAPHSAVAWSQPETPTEKSAIENFNGRMVEFLSTLPGWGGPKGVIEGLKDASVSAVLTDQDFTRRFHKWCFDEYSNTPGDDNLTPIERWHNGTELARPRLPADVGKVRLLLMIAKTLKLRPEGISLGPWLTYRNPRLDVIQRKLGHSTKIEIRYDPRDLNSIFVLDPETRNYFQVKSTSPRVTHRLTLYQYKLARKMAATKKRHHPSLSEMIAAKEELAELTRQLRWSKKRRERVMGKRASSPNSGVDVPTSTPGKTEIVTELEANIDDLAQVVLDDCGDWDCDLSFC